jgi:mitochondrial fission protein ELM1
MPILNTTPIQPVSDPLPRAWLLTNHRAGDNSQVVALAEMLGWPYEIKMLVHRSNKLLCKLISKQVMGVTLAGIDTHCSSRLVPPWPDLVISAGRDNEPVARWIQRKSGGRTRLVHMGRPWAPLHAFDLIVTTPQYFLPERDNVIQTELPLHRVTAERLAEARKRWQPRFAQLRPPYTVLLVGGNSGPLMLTRSKGRHLGRLANELVHSSGGSMLVTNSARTPPEAFFALCSEITVPTHIYHWGSKDEENPYFGYLALADQIVVTSESVSMLTEASVSGKPLFMYDLSEQAQDGAQPMPGRQRYLDRICYRSLRHWVATRFGPQRMKRDIGNIQRQLVGSGRASWLGQPAGSQRHALLPYDVRRDAQQALERIRQLFDL